MSYLLYHLCLQASVEMIHMHSACKQAKSGTFLITFGAPKTPSQFFGLLKFLIFLRFLSMVQFLGSAKIIIFTILKLVPILWVSQFLSTIWYFFHYFGFELNRFCFKIPVGCKAHEDKFKHTQWHKMTGLEKLTNANRSVSM